MPTPTILILDSDHLVAQDLFERLSNIGYTLLPVVERASDALSAINTGRPNLIVLDMNFGGALAGLQLAAGIRKAYDLPVIFIISEKNSTDLNHNELLDACGFLVVPFDNTSVMITLQLAQSAAQKQANIREKYAQLTTIIKNIGDGVVAIDEQGLIQFINPVAANLTGISETRAIGICLDNLVTLLDKTTQQKISASNLARSQRDTGPLSDFDILILSSNGTQIPVEGNIAPLRNHLGLPHGAIIVLRSLSQTQRSMQQIKDQAARSDALLRIIAHINSKLNIDTMLVSFLQESTQVLDADGAMVFLADNDDGALRIVASHAPNECLTACLTHGIVLRPQVIETLLLPDKPVVHLQNIQELTWVTQLDQHLLKDIHSLILARLRYEDHNLGVLAIFTTGHERTYSHHELQFIEGLANHASVAIATGQLLETLRTSRSRLQMVSKRLIEVQEVERRAVARELHDQIGQVLTGLQFTLETGKRSSEGNQRAIFENSQELVKNLMKQVRELSLRLSPAILDDMGLLRTLEWHFEQYTSQTGIQLQFSHSGIDKRLPSQIEITAYRIIQEALTNVARYAKVDQAVVALDVNNDVLVLQVKDQGCGFDPEKTVARNSTFGLTSMKERVFLVGGKLSIKTAPGFGTELLALIPTSKALERRRYDR